MRHPGRLRRRLILASFALATVICTLFSAVLFGALEYAEWMLFDQRIESDMETFIQQYEVDPGVVDLPRNNFMVFVAPEGDDSPLPGYLRDLDEDDDDVELDEREFHLDVRVEGGRRFFFMFEETTFDRFDQLLNVVIPAFIVTILAVAALLGLFMANRIAGPVSGLARKVRNLERELIPQPPEASAGDDEIEILDQAVTGFQARVKELLQREREFSSDVSHELRTPLMGIQAAAENLEVSSGQQERVGELSQRIQARCGQMRSLVDALLSLARDPQSIENDFQGLRIRDVVAGQVEANEPHIRGRNVTVRIIESGNALVRTSAAILDVVVGNLLRNAVLHSRSSEIHIELNDRGVVITDFGEGIPDNVRDRMFERYASNGDDPARDLGIGLSLVKRLCTHFDWRLDIRSGMGQGTTIAVDFGPSLQG